MGPTLRATRALVLLAGFYLLGLVLLAALAAVDWAAAVHTPGPFALKVFLVSAVLAVPIVRGMFMLRTPADEDMPGVRVDDSHEPRLWQTVRDIAQQVGTRAPDEILLTGDVNATVSEDARFLGLVGGTRRLHIGLPLMTGLSETQLRAVLAHEMGHYGNADTRLSAISERGRVHVLRTIAHFEARAGAKVSKERARQEKKAAAALAKGRKAREVDTTGTGITYRAMARLYTAYGKFYLRATLSGSRRAEFAADIAAARIAGRDATASALREIPVIDAAHDFYLNRYATLGADAGLLPPPGEFLGGFRHLLAARHEEVDAMRGGPLPTEPVSPYDSHPPIAERVARIEALPDDGRASDPARPSLSLLADTERTLATVEEAVLTPAALGLRRLDWPELVHAAMSVHTEESAQRFGALMLGAEGGGDASAEGGAGTPVEGGAGAPAEGGDGAPRPGVDDGAGRPGHGAESGTPEHGGHGTPRSELEGSGGGAGPLGAVLDAIDAGALWRMAERLPRSEVAAAATGRAAREFARPQLRAGLSQLVSAEYLRQGRARWQLSWTEPAALELPYGHADELPDALEAAVADRPDTEPLRALLAPVYAPEAPGPVETQPPGSAPAPAPTPTPTPSSTA
ncbi:M48 family metallopeptidase [Streptomyces griseus]|uniref:M48 family metallopeptidase n=1 Tax=Streptomyces stephensoniae TaxID=3375367 RepID=A0ABU2WA41_9ACTN|nr:M48 family metallopeptidase [Streptomyces griseus]MDT0494191.1 M48 family metallopeptidase [Streptomyces griseus]